MKLITKTAAFAVLAATAVGFAVSPAHATQHNTTIQGQSQNAAAVGIGNNVGVSGAQVNTTAQEALGPHFRPRRPHQGNTTIQGQNQNAAAVGIGNNVGVSGAQVNSTSQQAGPFWPF